jgi:hypothetical protein
MAGQQQQYFCVDVCVVVSPGITVTVRLSQYGALSVDPFGFNHRCYGDGEMVLSHRSLCWSSDGNEV